MGQHAALSPSSSHRWLNCSPSAKLEQQFADSESEAAAEGTAAHALCEHKLKRALKMRSKKPISSFDCDEMDAFTDGYVDFVLETLVGAKQRCKDPIVLIEQHLDFSCYVPEGFGTGDALVVGNGILNVIDFKYGQGLIVSSKENSQMKLYAIGALELFGNLYDIDEISMTIYQPRRENVSTWTISVAALKEWAEQVLKPRAILAYNGKGDYCPGEWCQFCKAAVKCRARAEAKLNLAKYEFALPPLLTDDEIEEILSKLDDLAKWASDIMAYATDSAINHGKQWTGFKVVEGRSVRKYTDDAAVADAAKAAGYMDIYKQSLITLTEMERLMGKEQFAEVLGCLIQKPPGKLTLVPDSDKRQAIEISNVHNDFKEDL